MVATGGLSVRMVPKRQQRGHVPVGHKPDVAALPAVPAVRAPSGRMCLAAERHRTRAALTCLYEHPGLVNKVAHRDSVEGTPPSGRTEIHVGPASSPGP